MSQIGYPQSNRIFPAVPSDLRQWTQYLNRMFYKGSYTITFQGTTADLTSTANYTVSANIVTLNIPLMLGTSNEVVAYILQPPPHINPINSQIVPIRTVDNGVTTWGTLIINTDTPWQVYPDSDATSWTWTNTGTKGVRGTTITYSLD